MVKCEFCGKEIGLLTVRYTWLDKQNNRAMHDECYEKYMNKSISKSVEDEKVEIIKDGKLKETIDEPKDKTKISGTSPMTKEATVYYKKYKKTVIALGILIILLLVSTASVFFNAQNQYNSLQYSLTSLQSQYDSEKTAYGSLSSSYNSLQTDYNSLQSNYNSLQNNYNSIQSSYDSYKRTVEIRWGQEADCEQFITPNNPSVISATSNVLGHPSDGTLSWDDMTAINDWVGKNIKYNYDTFDGTKEDCWLYPSETLSRGYGDCEDHALLMASMCKAEGSSPWLWCAWIGFNINGKTLGHVCIFVKCENNQLYIYDPTAETTSFEINLFGWIWGIHDVWHSSSSKSYSDALNEYKSSWGASTIQVVEIFNENEYHAFNSNQDFYNYF